MGRVTPVPYNEKDGLKSINNMNSNGFIRKKVDTLTLGETMKKLRQEMHFSLGDVSKATKIQIKYLEALEKGEYEKLPADVYVRGFLRNFASHMSINDKPLVKLYEREKSIQQNISPRAARNSFDNPISISKFVITPKIIIISSSILLCFGAFFYVYRELNEFVSTPRLIIIEPVNGKTVTQRSVNFVGKTDPGATLKINNQDVMVDENGEFREKMDMQPGMNTVSFIARSKFDKETVETISLKADYNEIVNVDRSPGEFLEVDNKTIKLEIWTQDIATWISVEADGNLVFSGTPEINFSQIFEAQSRVVVSSDRGNKTRIKINDKDMGTLTDDEKPTRGKTFEANL